MSRGARKTGGARRRRQSSVIVRKSQRRPIRKTIQIVGDGKETERNYFDKLKRENFVSKKFNVEVLKGSGKSPDKVIEDQVNKDFDEIWCVFDVEGSQQRRNLNKAIQLAEKNGIKLCLSNPCFEVWLLSHFERQAKAYINCKAVIERLNRIWKQRFGQKYQKNDEQIYDRISSMTQTAIENARWVRENHFQAAGNTADCNSSTEVYRLVGKLIGGVGDIL